MGGSIDVKLAERLIVGALILAVGRVEVDGGIAAIRCGRFSGGIGPGWYRNGIAIRTIVVCW